MMPINFSRGTTLLLVALIFFNSEACAQAVLPPGAGMFRASYRRLITPTQKFDENGNKVSHSSAYTTDFTGPEMLKGSFGEDLKQLASVLKEFDPATDGGLVDRLNIGRLDMNVKAKAQAWVLAVGMGLTPSITSYAAVPIIDVDINVTPMFVGNNSATKIKNELGDAAHPKISSGLDQASRVNLGTILENLSASGYNADKWHWKARQAGDAHFGVYIDGLKLSGMEDSPNQLLFNLDILAPTGYLGKENILVDTDLGRGYWVATGEASIQVQLVEPVWAGMTVGTGVGFPAHRQLRVPEKEDRLPVASRSAKVIINPGYDTNAKIGLGCDLDIVAPSLHVRYESHTRDSFSGNLAGNYAFMGKGSDYELYSSEISVNLSTVRAFLQKTFAVPILAQVSWRRPFAGRNKMSDEYIELTLSSFFPTPWAAP